MRNMSIRPHHRADPQPIIDMLVKHQVIGAREAVDRLIAAVRSEQQWQPIETAPKDRRVLLYVPFEADSDHAFQVGCFDDDYGTPSAHRRPFWRYECEPIWQKSAIYSRAHAPTHWMPLPSPPQESS